MSTTAPVTVDSIPTRVQLIDSYAQTEVCVFRGALFLEQRRQGTWVCTITAVTAHQSPGQHDTDVTQYDVSVKVGITTYVVLFTPPNGANFVKYAVGDELLILAGSNTLTFNSALSGKTEVPILSRETLQARTPDRSKSCGQCLPVKLQRLSGNLTDDQRAEVKPILEQEAGEVDEICFNPVLSQSDKLTRYEKIVRTSDAKIKPLLSTSQLQKTLGSGQRAKARPEENHCRTEKQQTKLAWPASVSRSPRRFDPGYRSFLRPHLVLYGEMFGAGVSWLAPQNLCYESRSTQSVPGGKTRSIARFGPQNSIGSFHSIHLERHVH